MDEQLQDISAALWADSNSSIHDRALDVRFFIRAKQDMIASAKEGRPVYVDTEYVTIAPPMEKLNIIERPATRKDKARFRAQYLAFQDGNREAVTGTPLERMGTISPAQVETLKHCHVRTVEQLALTPDGNLPNMRDVTHLKKQAQDYLDFAKGMAPATQLRAELEKRDSQIAALQAQMADLISAKQEDSEAPKRGPGRPRKDASNGDV